MKTIPEPNREIPVADEVDVLVVGGGPTGVGAALSATVLAYACGYMGLMLSPVHACLIVTTEHFRTHLAKILLRLLGPASIVILGAVSLHYVVRLLVP